MVLDEKSNKVKHLSQHLMCPVTGISYDEPAPNSFSFNSPYGACPKCNGLGTVPEIDELENLLNIITTQSPSSIDLGLVDGEWFGAVLSSGFDSVVNEKANKLKWPKGPSKYNLAIALELPLFKPSRFQIELDDRTIDTEAMLIAVGNGSSYGGGMRVCPEASITDGFFDVMVLNPITKIEFIKVFPKVYTGEHINHPEVNIYRTKKIQINSVAVAYADGERIGALPISAECVRGAGLTWKN